MRPLWAFLTWAACLVAPDGAMAQIPSSDRTPSDSSDSLVTVVMETELGEIEIALDVERAPLTATNFLRYVDAGLYEGGTFYRTVREDNQPDDSVRIAVVQGGMNRDRRREAFDPIRLEGTEETGLTHADGTISMARAGPNSARAEFFICVGPQHELDAGGRRNSDGLGFAAFGRVTKGMEVVRQIHRRAAEGQSLRPPVRILRVRRLRAGRPRPSAGAHPFRPLHS